MRFLICIDLSSLRVCSCSVLGAERTACRRLISLIFAGWLPHDNRFVGELPRSSVEDHSVAGRLIEAPRVLPPLPILLPTRCMSIIPLHCPRTRRRLCNGPDEAGELAGDRGAHLHALLAATEQMAIALTQPLLRFPGDVLDRFACALGPALQQTPTCVPDADKSMLPPPAGAARDRCRSW